MSTDVPVRGPWSRERIHEHLDAFDGPMRLSFLDGDGHPRVLSLWFTRHGDELRGATQQDAVLVRCLQQDPRVGVEIAGDRPPYRGVRGRGRAVLDTAAGPEVLDGLIDRYLQADDPLASWLRARADDEVAVLIRPEAWFSWDYSGRMAPR
jgi:nitroimidazol reductase NimA-like FMN-containing flavoprotein (pyridoxamine 5'-phosphate oxidase superfamily)